MQIRRYRPSNGTDGMAFMAEWCDRCIKANLDEESERPPCPILGRAMGLPESAEGYPTEWQLNECNDPICTAFKHKDDKQPEVYRCPDTVDLFGGKDG